MAWSVLLILLNFTACASPQSTRLQVSDFDELSDRMAESLAGSGAITQRTAADEPWWVSMQRVENLSTDVMTPGEQWAIVQRVRSAQPLQVLWDRHQIRFLESPEDVVAARALADPRDPYAADRRSTHVLTGTLRSITRAQQRDRTELYDLQMRLVDLATGEDVWSDNFSIKREARGLLWD
jgi:hypothetical protein